MVKILADSTSKERLSSALRGNRLPLPSTLTESDLHRLIDTSENEGVTSLLRNQLQKSGHLDSLPAALTEQLRTQELQYVALNLKRQNEVKEVLQLLQSQELDFLLMKGEALASTIYDAPHLRTRCDTDLLFRDKETTEKAWLVLEKAGYTRERTLEGKFVGYQFSCGRFLGTGMTNTFDIHNQISDYVSIAKKFSFDELNHSAVSLNYCGLQAKCFNSVYALLHASLHRISNRPLAIQDRLIWLYDIHLLCTSLSHSEWEAFCCLSEEKTMASVCLEGIKQSVHYFHTEIPTAFFLTLTVLAKKEPRGLNDMNRRWQMYAYDWLHNEGAVNKMRQLTEHLFPSPQYMMWKYQVTSRAPLLYYYLKRILQGIIKYK
jgi:hypothetical protein